MLFSRTLKPPTEALFSWAFKIAQHRTEHEMHLGRCTGALRQVRSESQLSVPGLTDQSVPDP